MAEPVGHCATHTPALQIWEAHCEKAEQDPPLETRQTPATLVFPAGHAHELVVAFQTDPVGVEHEHVVAP